MVTTLSTKHTYHCLTSVIWQRQRRLSIGYRSYASQTYPIKTNAVFFQAAVVSILLYRRATWTLTKCMEKKLDGYCTRMLRVVLNKSWGQHPTKKQLYSHLPPISKTIQIRQTRHVGHCLRSKDELISDVLRWTPLHGRARVGRPARTYIQQPCTGTGCNMENLPGAMDDRGSRKSVFVARHDNAAAAADFIGLSEDSIYTTNTMLKRSLIFGLHVYELSFHIFLIFTIRY